MKPPEPASEPSKIQDMQVLSRHDVRVLVREAVQETSRGRRRYLAELTALGSDGRDGRERALLDAGSLKELRALVSEAAEAFALSVKLRGAAR